jgi:signal recognition particle subunit SRP54
VIKYQLSQATGIKNMFESFTERLHKALRKITGKANLSAENIKEVLTEVDKALLEADVSFAVVKKFNQAMQDKLIGQEVTPGLSPEQFFIKQVNKELVSLMGEVHQELKLNVPTPAIILMAGLQGSGKTTTAAKLAKILQEKQKKKVMLVSCDIYRPAAIEQLRTVTEQVGAIFFPSNGTENPVDIAKNAIKEARKKGLDVLIVDTAGRMHINDVMMTEIKAIHSAINPAETLFVVDSMTGQDAANTAKVFNDALTLTGVILTKTDGDARGGAALSIRAITQKPIKYLGTGEKLDALEAFHPERIASRILGMGDVLSLVEELEDKINKEKADKLAKKLKSGKGFNLADYKDQLEEIKKMGGLASLAAKLPGVGSIISKDALTNANPDKQTNKAIAIINSMTAKERKNPDLIKGSRKNRIAKGSGTQLQDVNKVLKDHDKMQRMFKKFNSAGAMMRMMNSMKGRMPRGMPPGR